MTQPLTASTINDDILDGLHQELARLRAAVALHHPVRDEATGLFVCDACSPQVATERPRVYERTARVAWPCTTAIAAGAEASITEMIAPQSLRDADGHG
ncbi:hypothetical protein [Streptomyces sp. H27-C3]|uniref:hypothetical protein n=1 Tax=Streptomyces sp. H27-C3 TaxID=3046305 RepID=UPI0024B98A17|nr:hypothetical protein [Streptomyces sp. H27-C3]MDJ0466116.1 hypothetical protein [Streptomyces sp. H27-C3]